LRTVREIYGFAARRWRVCGLIAAGLGYWLYVTNSGESFPDAVGRGSSPVWVYFKLLLSGAVFAGLIWLGWSWLSLRRQIASIIRQLKETGENSSSLIIANDKR